MKKWLLSLLFSLILFRISTAQVSPYTGGDGSGYSTNQLAFLNCLMYVGGAGSGAASAKSQLLSCLMYTGGDAAGYSTERTNLLSCVMYFGDSADGAVSRYAPLADCPWYYGSDGDGYDKDSIGWCQILLPLKVLDFSGLKEANRNTLLWRVTDTQNLSWFEVERSNNGVHFTPIGVVQAAGKRYELADNAPVPGINFYRLRIIEKNGKISLSGIVVLRSFEDSRITVFPNPAKGHTNMYYQSTKLQSVNLCLFNMSGNVILRQRIQLHKGSNHFLLHFEQVSPGLYLLTIPETGDKLKLVIQ